MKFCYLLIWLSSLGCVSAQEGGSKNPPLTVHVGALSSDTLEPELKKMCDGFFAQIKTGAVVEAYREFLKGSEIGKVPRLVEEFVGKTKEILKQHGKMADVELLKAKATGKHLRMALFQLSCENHPTQWRIYAYVVEDRWQILNIEVTSDLPKMIE